MKPGDRVSTSRGHGVITALEQRTEWALGRPDRKQVAVVELDKGGRMIVYTDQIWPLPK